MADQTDDKGTIHHLPDHNLFFPLLTLHLSLPIYFLPALSLSLSHTHTHTLMKSLFFLFPLSLTQQSPVLIRGAKGDAGKSPGVKGDGSLLVNHLE